jgi:hypothetical protein
MSEQLTSIESLRLLALEKTIREGKQKFVEVGVALEEIRDRKLYRNKFKTFEEYCQNQWGFSRQYAHQFIKGAVAVKALPPNLSTQIDKPKTAAALAKVDDEKRVEVVKAAAKTGAVTAKSITSADKALSAVPEKVVDELGWPVPVDLHALWNRREEIKSLIREFDRIKNTVDKATKDGDELYLELHNSVVSDFQKVRASLVRAVPYAVCTCNGRKEIKCSLCRGRGFLSRFLWGVVPKEIKDMRAKKVGGK